ncbi:MAG: VCBS repeat-containing protein [Verrucomicrobiaceae bacterium]|nr:MAG: VCBS repeat-containing protein [Verrucomicrobiaceae bacterium]
MKTRHIFTGSLLVVSVTAPLHAWPFVSRTTSVWDYAEQGEMILFQANNDAALELYRGGNQVMHPVVGGTGTTTALPVPDYDPYFSNWPVSFVGGNGAVGDVDGDGDVDIVRSAVIAYNGQAEPNYRMMTCLNNGFGQFTRGWHFKQTTEVDGLGARAPFIKLADLDRDGDLDLIENFPHVRVHWNPGNGDFSTSITTLYSSAFRVQRLEVADFNGDGWTDVAAFVGVKGLHPDYPNWTTGRLVLLTNNSGTFSASTVTTRSPGSDYIKSAVADIDNDGKPDLLASANDIGTLHWFRNTGSGFAAAASLPAPGMQAGSLLASGDLDGDGKTDVVFSGREHKIEWMRGLGSGLLAAPAVLRDDNATTAPICLGVDDIDADGDPDILFDAGWNVLENTECHYSSTGAGAVTAVTYTNPTGDVDLETADVNGDGREDLVVADGGGKRLLWYGGTSDGLTAPWLVSTSGLVPTSVAAGDFDRDGFTDLAWTTTNAITRAYGTNGSGFSWTTAGLGSMSGILGIQRADIDGDGDDDLLAHSTSTLRFFKNDGAGGGWLPENITTGESGITAAAAGQSTPGGRMEASVIIPAAGAGYFMQYKHTVGGWSIDDGANTPAGGSSSAVIMADMTPATRGLETIFAINEATFRVTHPSYAWPLTGAGTHSKVNQLAAADWNGDGWNDILCATSAGLNLYLNQRTPTWSQSAPIMLYGAGAVQDVVVMNLNDDRLPDAVVAAADGSLHQIFNRGGQLHVSQFSAAVTNLEPGKTATVTTITGTNRGRPAGAAPLIADTGIAPTQSLVRFLKAQWVNGSWQPGSAMTTAEVTAAVESLSYNGSASSVVPNVVNQGVFSMPVNQITRTLLCALPGRRRPSISRSSSSHLPRSIVSSSSTVAAVRGRPWTPMATTSPDRRPPSLRALRRSPAL